MTTASEGATAKPFNGPREWSWPAALRVSIEGDTVVIRSDAPSEDPPDVRALSLLEAESERPEVLIFGRPFVMLELRLGESWKGDDLARLMRRLGMFPDSLRQRFTISVAGKELRVPDAFGGALGHVLDQEFDGVVEVRGDGLGLVAKGLDAWLAEVELRQDRAGDQRPPLAVLRLVPAKQALHPRASWIVAQLASRGLRIEAPLRSRVHAQPDFIVRLTDAVTDYKERVLGITECGSFYETPYPHILPSKSWKMAVWEPLRKRVEDVFGRQRHGMFHNLKSSQAFAANVLLGLEHDAALPRALERALGWGEETVAEVGLTLEFCPPEMKKFLGERGKHQTQVDALARVTLSNGSVEALLFEVKLTEADFGSCRGPFVETNARRDVCGENALDRESACYLAAQGRTYLQHLPSLGSFAAILGSTCCPLRDGGYQLARNLLVARWLEGSLGAVPRAYKVDRARFFVLSASETPALSSPTLERVAKGGGAQALEQLGVGWVDARNLVDAASPSAELRRYLTERYPPVFAQPRVAFANRPPPGSSTG